MLSCAICYFCQYIFPNKPSFSSPLSSLVFTGLSAEEGSVRAVGAEALWRGAGSHPECVAAQRQPAPRTLPERALVLNPRDCNTDSPEREWTLTQLKLSHTPRIRTPRPVQRKGWWVQTALLTATKHSALSSPSPPESAVESTVDLMVHSFMLRIRDWLT